MDKSNERQVHIIAQVMLCMATIAALLLLTNAARSESLRAAPKVGEEYEISKRYETSEQTSDGSSGSYSGRDTIIERVIGVREGGLELEFDLPKEATAEDRARSWQFPVRVFRPTNGSMQLLNRPELEARIEGWLKAAGWTRAACGRWIFTWNAFRIECDPESVIKAVEQFDLRFAGNREGVSYQEAEASGPGMLTRKSTGPDGATFAVVLVIDPDAVRRARAESDVAVGEMMQEPVTLDAALRERAKEDVSGTISVTIDTDPAGNIWRRTKVTKVEIKGPDGRTESQAVTETVERRPVRLQGVPVCYSAERPLPTQCGHWCRVGYPESRQWTVHSTKSTSHDHRRGGLGSASPICDRNHSARWFMASSFSSWPPFHHSISFGWLPA